MFDIKRHKLKIFLLIITSGMFLFDDGVAFAYQNVPAAINLESEVGGSALPPEEVVQRVRNAGIKVAIFSDKNTNEVEYGLFPLRNLIKKVEKRESIIRYGAQQYINRIENIASQNPDMVILHGAEAVPFYYWEGSVFSGLTIKNFHKNILVFGLEKAEDYKDMPSVSSKKAFKFSINCLINFWPIIVVMLGFLLFSHKKRCTYSYIVNSNNSTGEVKLYKLIMTKWFGVVLMAGGIVFLINNYPFCNNKFDQYHGDKGAEPYQELIDYVNAKGGLTFWSSPDVDYATYKYGPVTFDTRPYYDDLLKTKGYTGFAVFAEGMKHTGIPGGIWDKVLIEYVNGLREKPVWAIGELDYEEGGWIAETQTVMLVNQVTKADALDALRKGRMYAVTGSSGKPVLEVFNVWDNINNRWVEMGESAKAGKITRLRIRLTIPTGQEEPLKIIRDGEVVKEFNVKSGIFDETIEITNHKPKGMTYYRIDIGSRLISNPIFIFLTGDINLY